jgi:hypothetical protein
MPGHPPSQYSLPVFSSTNGPHLARLASRSANADEPSLDEPGGGESEV